MGPDAGLHSNDFDRCPGNSVRYLSTSQFALSFGTKHRMEPQKIRNSLTTNPANPKPKP